MKKCLLLSASRRAERACQAGERQVSPGHFSLCASGFARETFQVLQLLAQRERADERRSCLLLGEKTVGRLRAQVRVFTENLLPHDV